MPSRRRSRNKNLGNNLADVQRRLRFLERRPVRSKLSSRVVTKAAIAPNSVSKDEVAFGIVETVPPGQTADYYAGTIENPKEGQFLITTTGATAGESQVYSEATESYISVADPVAQTSADAAVDAAALAAANAQAAQTTADGKNKVYRQASQPTTGPFAEGDLWFDTDDDNKIYRYTGGSWSTAVQLGNNAIASLSASKLTAGTIDANVITVSNINAGNITAGNIASERLSTTQLNATNITAGTLAADRIGAGTINASIAINGPTITGGTIRTSAGDSPSTYNRVELSSRDEIRFFDENDTVVGRLGPFDFGAFNTGLVMTGGESYSSSPYINLQNANGSASIYLGIAGSYPSINMYSANTSNADDTGGMLISTGGATSATGEFRVVAGNAGISLESWTNGGGAADFIQFRETGNLDLFANQINMFGAITVYGETVEQGTGVPTFTGISGQLYFKYT
jgi:hypothetical protein